MNDLKYAEYLATDCLNSGKDTRQFAENFQVAMRDEDFEGARQAIRLLEESARKVVDYAKTSLERAESHYRK